MPDHSTNRLPMGPDNTPNIKVIFRGFIITRIRHGATEAMIGALAPGITDAACHKPIIHVYEINTDDVTTERRDLSFGLEEDFSLRVGGTPSVQIFQKDEDPIFNRLDDIDDDKKDFRWFIDLNAIHNRTEANRIQIIESRLKPRFFLDRGVFHTSKLSDGEVRILRAPFTQSKRFGRFAMEITARIVLTAEEQAVFRYGSTELLRMGGVADTNRYEIVFDCTCRSQHENDSDFARIYDVITDEHGNPIPEAVRLEPPANTLLTQKELDDLKTQQVSSLDDNFKTPEVYCSGGNG